MVGKLAVLALVIMLGLGALGVAFAGWSQELAIDGTATTGRVQMEFTECVASDNEGPDVDFGTTMVECLDLDGDGVVETMVVDIQRGYAGYTGIVDFSVSNTGTVPLHVSEIVMPEVVDGIAVEVSGIAVGDQVHPCNTLSGRLTIDIQTSEPGTYEFTLRIAAVNWNEEVNNDE